MTPIPVEYNAHVLHLLEGFSKLQRRKDEADARITELKEARERDLEEFKSMSAEWISRENNYKAEIKRLELLLATTSSNGMETVALARSNSLVDRKDTRRFVAKINQISAADARSECPSPPLFDSPLRSTLIAFKTAIAKVKKNRNQVQ